jgi:hypothetical protein
VTVHWSFTEVRTGLARGANRIRTAGTAPAKGSAAGRPSRTPARKPKPVKVRSETQMAPSRGPPTAVSFSVGDPHRYRAADHRRRMQEHRATSKFFGRLDGDDRVSEGRKSCCIAACPAPISRARPGAGRISCRTGA